jgi:hypothetical protein
MAALPETEVALGPAHEATKRAACRAYRSQLGFQFGGEAGLDAKLTEAGAVERFRLQRTPTFVIPGQLGGLNPEPTTGCATPRRSTQPNSHGSTQSWVPGSPLRGAPE